VRWSILSCFLCLHRVSSHWLYSLNPIIPLLQGKISADGYKKERRDERKGGNQVWKWRRLTFKSNDSCGSPLVPCFCRTFPMLLLLQPSMPLLPTSSSQVSFSCWQLPNFQLLIRSLQLAQWPLIIFNLNSALATKKS
jgi:hypothetical protein